MIIPQNVRKQDPSNVNIITAGAEIIFCKKCEFKKLPINLRKR